MSSPQLFVIIVAVPLTFAMTCLADDPPASLPSHVSNDSFVAVRLNDGHLTQGVVDERTDEERLWLRVELPSTRLISGFRWTFFGQGDVAIGVSMAFIAGMLTLCAIIVAWIFRTGYRL